MDTLTETTDASDPSVVSRPRGEGDPLAGKRGSLAPSPDTWAVLGGLRFFLATVVMCGHYAQDYLPDPWLRWAVILNPTVAVYCFLFISGYSIAASVERGTAKEFYMRRAWRILPVYWASFLFFGAVIGAENVSGHITHHAPVGTEGLPMWIAAACMLQGMLTPNLASNSSIWSLSLECAYYLFAPLFRRTSTVILGILIGISAAFYAGIVHLPSFAPSHANVGCFVHLAWCWIGGFALYRSRHPALAALCAIGAIPVYLHYGALPCTMVLITTVLLRSKSARMRPCDLKLLTYLGDLSYPLYIFHLPAFYIAAIIWPDLPPWITLLAAVLISKIALDKLDLPLRERRKRHAGASYGAIETRELAHDGALTVVPDIDVSPV